MAAPLPGRTHALFRLAPGAPPAFASVSGAVQALCGRSRTELVDGRVGVLDLVHPDDRPLFAARLARAWSEPVAELVRLQQPAGGECFVEWCSWPEGGGVEGVLRSADAPPEMGRAIEEHALRLFEDGPLPMFVYERGSWRFLAANAAARARYGYTSEELLAMTLFDLRPPEEAERLRARVDEMHARPGSFGHWLHRTKDGTLIQVEVHSQQLQLDERCVFLATVIDRTRQLADEAEVRFQKRLLETQLEASPDGIAFVSPTGEPLGANRRAIEMWGVAEAPPLGRVPAALQASLVAQVVDPPDWEAYCRRLDADPVTRDRVELTLGDGRVFERRSTPIGGADGVHLGRLKLFRDVTEQKRSERALRASEQRLQVLLGCTRGLAFELEYDGRIVNAWTGDDSQLAVPREAFLGRNVRDIFEPTVAGFFLELVGRVVQSGKPTTCEYPLATGGEERWFSGDMLLLPPAEGAAPTLAFLTRDVTERRRSEEARRRSEQSFRTLTEQLPDGVLVQRGDAVVYANPALLACLGYESAAQLVGRPAQSLVPAEEWPQVAAHLAAADGGDRRQVELRLLRRDGQSVVTEAVIIHADFDGERSAVWVVHDVTERRALQSRLVIADRMASVGTLAAGVAHEINNPLAFVLSNVTFVTGELARLQREGVEPNDPTCAELRDALDDAREGAQRVRRIVSDLKTFSRADDEQRGPVDLARVLETAIGMAWNEIRHRARLVRDVQPVGIIEANESRLAQVFLNLLVNAAQAIPEGHAERNEIRVRIWAPSPELVSVSVQDSGVGIPERHLQRIFDPFFTTKQVGVGTGLGLSICHNIVRALGGNLRVATQPGRGSTFTVELPLRPAERALGPRSPSRPPAGPRARVLVVDDEESIGRSIRRLLQRDHDVETTTSPHRALERIASGQRYDAILCDVMMPDLTGTEFWSALADTVPEQAARVTFMTGGAFTPAARDFLAAEGRRTLEKPLDEAALRALLAASVGPSARAS